jgi:hypothetical protein
MDINHFENLGKKVDASIAAIRAAVEEDRQALRQRIDKAQVDATLALKDTEQKAGKAVEDGRSQWVQMKTDASTKMTEVKAKIDQRGTEINAEMAETDAEMAEANATAATDYAGWAIDNARLCTLSALDARAHASQLQKASPA